MKLFSLKTILIVNLIMLSIVAHSQQQKQITEREQLWLGYFNQARFSTKWGMWIDVHQRFTDNFAERPFLTMMRIAPQYYLADNIRVAAGYCGVWFYKTEKEKAGHIEHRPWQQIWWQQKYNGYQTVQWLRFEQRFVQKVLMGEPADEFRFNYRLRYNFMLAVPFTKKKIEKGVPFGVLQDEVFINMGKEVVHNIFDQNRFFVGMGYQLTDHMNIQLGYMSVFQQANVPNNYTLSHCVRLFVFQTLDFRTSETHP